MNKLSDLKVGDWMPVSEGGFSVKLDKESYYSSNNQDAIMTLSLQIKCIERLKRLEITKANLGDIKDGLR